MNPKEFLSDILKYEGVKTFQIRDDGHVRKKINELELRLPAEHAALLNETDGLEWYWGYFRMFGLSGSDGINLIDWNKDDNWKFAWDGAAAAYFCFGETGWGDQYAYRYEDLSDTNDPPVHYLQSYTMKPIDQWENFSDFLENEVLRNASEPYYPDIDRAKMIHGPLALGEHLIHSPPYLMTGDEDPGLAHKIDARASMIINGDAYVQFEEYEEREIDSFEAYEDELGRPRLKVNWA